MTPGEPTRCVEQADTSEWPDLVFSDPSHLIFGDLPHPGECDSGYPTRKAKRLLTHQFQLARTAFLRLASP